MEDDCPCKGADAGNKKFCTGDEKFFLRNALKYGIISFVRLLVKAWLRGQAVKTSPFHGGNTGSIPVGVIFTKEICNEAEN